MLGREAAESRGHPRKSLPVTSARPFDPVAIERMLQGDLGRRPPHRSIPAQSRRPGSTLNFLLDVAGWRSLQIGRTTNGSGWGQGRRTDRRRQWRDRLEPSASPTATPRRTTILAAAILASCLFRAAPQRLKSRAQSAAQNNMAAPGGAFPRSAVLTDERNQLAAPCSLRNGDRQGRQPSLYGPNCLPDFPSRNSRSVNPP